MADTKIKVPIALPKSGESAAPAASSMSQEVALKNAIGSRIRVTTSAGTHEGVLFTADPITNILALQTAALPSTSTPTFPSGSYKIFPTSSVTSFQLLSTSPSKSLEIHALDTSALQSRHAAAMAKAADTLARKGPAGTTPLAQALFDGLARTFGKQVRWKGTQILVSDSTVVDRPYKAEDVRLIEGAGRRAGELERMKKVVSMEREKARLKGFKDVFETRGG